MAKTGRAVILQPCSWIVAEIRLRANSTIFEKGPFLKIVRCLPLYALPRIYPYRSYIGTLQIALTLEAEGREEIGPGWRRPSHGRTFPPEAPAPCNAPKASPTEDESKALRATHSPATARKGGIQGGSTGGLGNA
jgi:hypothetical protein